MIKAYWSDFEDQIDACNKWKFGKINGISYYRSRLLTIKGDEIAYILSNYQSKNERYGFLWLKKRPIVVFNGYQGVILLGTYGVDIGPMFDLNRCKNTIQHSLRDRVQILSPKLANLI